MKLGRNALIAPRQRMRLASFLAEEASLPTPPTECDFRLKAMAALGRIYLNDKLGDCVIAWLFHLVGLLTGNATGTAWVGTDALVEKFYGFIGGYVPGDPSTDQGCNEQDALDYVAHNGCPDGTKVLGSLLVDATNKLHVQLAMWLCENLTFGVGLPDEWVQNEPSASGFVWDVAGPANPNNGHCFGGVGYNAKGIFVSTWGMTGLVTWAAAAKYAVPAAGGELHVTISPDQLAKGQSIAPNAVAWDTIVQVFDALGGKVPVPVQPPPVPATKSLTLAQAQNALMVGWPK